MEVRDAVEGDAEALARLADGPHDVIRNVIHDRTVRVVEDEGDLVGFVSFDAQPGTVHITQLDGTAEVLDRLLEEPVRFARREGMAVEVLVTERNDAVHDAVTRGGFDRAGSGPQFRGTPTTRYRYRP